MASASDVSRGARVLPPGPQGDPSRAATSNELDDHIQALPQELQDEILELTLGFTLDSNPQLVTIDANYKPPWQLSVNRRARGELAERYYSTSTFRADARTTDARTILVKWLVSLSKQHQAILADVRVGSIQHEPPLWPSGTASGFGMVQHRYLGIRVGAKGEDARSWRYWLKENHDVRLQSTTLRCVCLFLKSTTTEIRWEAEDGTYDLLPPFNI